jgi:putative ABC transport system permease protein
MDTLLGDVRHAVRGLLRAPGFTGVALIVLAFGIGATTALFSVVHGVLLRALPYADPDRLVQVFSPEGPGLDRGNVSFPDFVDLRESNRVFAGMAAANFATPTLTAAGLEPTRLTAAGATSNLFQLLGAAPLVGRTWSGESEAQRECVVVLSEGLWRERFGGSAEAVGRVVTLDGTPCTVLGVMPASFRIPAGAELWFPLKYPGQESRGVHNLRVLARLRPGVTVAQADADLKAVAASLARQYPETNAKVTARVVPAHEAMVGRVRTTLVALFGAVLLVLLVACANLAGLQLARATARRREVAIRAALGAGRGRLVRQLLLESALLGIGGGALGVLVAAWSLPLILAAAPDSLPRLEEIALDGPVLAFAAAVAVGTGVLFGILPALHGSRAGALIALRDSGRTTAGPRGARARQLLVVGELALAVVLVAGAGLLAKSLWRVSRVDPGFAPDGLLAVTLQVPESKYEQTERRVLFFEQVLERVRAIGGVRSAAIAMGHPLDPGWTSSFSIVGREPPAPGMAPEENLRVASPGYFRTVGVPLLAGRDFDARDRVGGPGAVIVNEAFARRHFPGESPLGRTLDRGQAWWPGMPTTFEVVGVVGDERFAGLTTDPQPAMYFPYPQYAFWGVALMVRVDCAAGAPRERCEPRSLVARIREAVHALDPDIPVEEAQWMSEAHDAAMAGARFNATLLGAYAVLALLLAAVGLYGVLAYLVAQRTHEIGIRIALGAARARVMRLVLGQGLALAGAGLALGLAGAAGATRALRGMLFGVAPTDAAVYAALALLLGAVALLACWLPARRAVRVDPMVALRAE